MPKRSGHVDKDTVKKLLEGRKDLYTEYFKISYSSLLRFSKTGTISRDILFKIFVGYYFNPKNIAHIAVSSLTTKTKNASNTLKFIYRDDEKIEVVTIQHKTLGTKSISFLNKQVDEEPPISLFKDLLHFGINYVIITEGNSSYKCYDLENEKEILPSDTEGVVYKKVEDVLKDISLNQLLDELLKRGYEFTLKRPSSSKEN